MINQTELRKICSKKIDENGSYLGYALDNFVGELKTIKKSIKTSAVAAVLKKYPETKISDIDAQIEGIIEEKIATTISIEFKG